MRAQGSAARADPPRSRERQVPERSRTGAGRQATVKRSSTAAQRSAGRRSLNAVPARGGTVAAKPGPKAVKGRSTASTTRTRAATGRGTASATRTKAVKGRSTASTTRARAATGRGTASATRTKAEATGTARRTTRKVVDGSRATKRAPAAGPRTSKTAARRRKTGARTHSHLVMRSQPAYFVVIPTVMLILLGLVMVFSAGTVYGLNQVGYRFFVQQLGWALLGFVLMIFGARIDYHKLAKASLIGVLASIALLATVLVLGRISGGARLGMNVGPLYLQPTELVKFTLVIFAAYALSRKGEKVKRFAHLAIPVMVFAVVEAVLMLLQPDFGSALIMLLAVLMVMALSEGRLTHVAAMGAGLGAAAAVAVIKYPYLLDRIKGALDPGKDPQGYGYQVIQSQIALGTGHIKGLGLGMSRQKFLYLPNAHNDFIFAIIGEELGLLGTLAVVLLIGVLAFGGLRIASGAPDELGRMLACGITGLIVIQALVNMGGVTGLLPITGVPLPLVSSGGSSLCVCMGSIGILLNVAAQGSR